LDFLKVPQINKPSTEQAKAALELNTLRGLLMREGILLPTANDLLVQSYINMTNQFPITVLFTL